MKRAVVLVVVLLVSALFVALTEAADLGYVTDLPAIVKIHSPYENQVYSSRNIVFSVSVESPRKDYWEMTSVKITIFLDNKAKSAETITQYLDQQGLVASYESVLRVEEEGLHSMYILADIEYLSHHPAWPVSDFTGSGKSDVVNFRVETPPPIVTILSPGFQEAFNYSSVWLEFCVSKDFSWVGYSLDGKDNVTVSGNSTLSGLSAGQHEIVVYATDLAGQTRCSHTRYFTVAESSASFPTPFPLMWFAVAVVASAAAVSFGLVAYFLQRKRKSGET
jgi:hypothetical protein